MQLLNLLSETAAAVLLQRFQWSFDPNKKYISFFFLAEILLKFLRSWLSAVVSPLLMQWPGACWKSIFPKISMKLWSQQEIHFLVFAEILLIFLAEICVVVSPLMQWPGACWRHQLCAVYRTQWSRWGWWWWWWWWWGWWCWSKCWWWQKWQRVFDM